MPVNEVSGERLKEKTAVEPQEAARDATNICKRVRQQPVINSDSAGNILENLPYIF